VAEEEAEANFNTAAATAKLAQQRMDTANSLAGRQLAAKEWPGRHQRSLPDSPRHHVVYPQAQTQLQGYQQELQRSTQSEPR
jgi:hypothetical protein